MARRTRDAESFRRRAPTREPYESVLIVCEGGKTEPNYFGSLRTLYRLSSANIRITPAVGTDPMSVVTFAEHEAAQDDYDRIFCVFDRDEHATYNAALARITELDKFVAIASWPCFEVWILLHYRYSSAPIERAGKLSACDRAIREIRNHFPGYTKGSKGVFGELQPLLDEAIRHAHQLCHDNEQTGSVNPATNVQELVEFLIRLKD